MTKYALIKQRIHQFMPGLTLFLVVSLFSFLVSPSQAADVTLAWNPNSENDLAGYAIYASQDASGPPYDHVSSYTLAEIDPANPRCVITGLEDDLVYYFVVTALDTEGNESDFSDDVCVLNGKDCANLDVIQDFVTRFYQECLDRNPDAAGLQGWSIALFNHDLAGADVARGFIYSPEFIEKNTTNEEYLTILYRAFFNRNPDPTGWNGWLDVLNSGTDRGHVLNGFLFSIEFAELCDAYDIVPN
jgi:hypothetical protein